MVYDLAGFGTTTAGTSNGMDEESCPLPGNDYSAVRSRAAGAQMIDTAGVETSKQSTSDKEER